MANPFRTDLIAIFVRRGHKGKMKDELRDEIAYEYRNKK
jgi:hypothetical protein